MLTNEQCEAKRTRERQLYASAQRVVIHARTISHDHTMILPYRARAPTRFIGDMKTGVTQEFEGSYYTTDESSLKTLTSSDFSTST
jgi:hypothetical protein